MPGHGRADQRGSQRLDQKIILATADGLGTMAIMRATGKSKPCVWRWQERFAAEGVDGLTRDKTRKPGRAPLSAAVKRKVLTKTAGETPPEATHWSVRSMAAAVGISHTSVQRIWAEAGFKPHLVRRFKISNDPAFEEYSDITQLPRHVARELRRFFEDYKILESKSVIVEDPLGPEEAKRVIDASFELYRQEENRLRGWS